MWLQFGLANSPGLSISFHFFLAAGAACYSGLVWQTVFTALRGVLFSKKYLYLYLHIVVLTAGAACGCSLVWQIVLASLSHFIFF
jgi:hypothetical protein